jgi:FtsP/CotA-like multicopper oxidase with cupredoxin domain
MGAPAPVSTYTFDHVVPGHTWEVRPGDTLSVDLINRLPALHPGWRA